MRMHSLLSTLGEASARGATSAFATGGEVEALIGRVTNLPPSIATDDASDCASHRRTPPFILHGTIFAPGRIRK